MNKIDVIKRLTDCGVVAVVRAENEKKAKEIAKACIMAGIVGIEITFTVPGALKIIEALCKEYSEKLIAAIAAGGWIVIVIVIAVGAILFIVDSAVLFERGDRGCGHD